MVGFGAGGPTDIPPASSPTSSATRSASVVVENKPAAAGMLATRDVLGQPRDGYTLLLCTHFEPINVAVYKNAQFALSDLAPISLIAKYYYGLALANAIPADDFDAFVQYAKTRPGEVSYATIGAGLGAGDPGAPAREAGRHLDEPILFRGGPQVVQELVAGRPLLRLADAGDHAAIPEQAAQDHRGVEPGATYERAGNSDPDRQGLNYVRFWLPGICAGAARRSRSSISSSGMWRQSSPRPSTAP